MTRNSSHERWLWYAARTRRCVPLDAEAYGSTIIAGEQLPLPDWVCHPRGGGLHVDHRAGRIDVDVAKAPVSGIEINWTCDSFVHIISRSWLAEIEDLIDEGCIFVGDVRRAGRRLRQWATLNERCAPTLFSAQGHGVAGEGTADICAICGRIDTSLWGKLYFSDPAVIGRPVIVGEHGIFVRQDLALGRNLRKPAGAFKPPIVGFNPGGTPTFVPRHFPPPDPSAPSNPKLPSAEAIYDIMRKAPQFGPPPGPRSLRASVWIVAAATALLAVMMISGGLGLNRSNSAVGWLSLIGAFAAWAGILLRWLRIRRTVRPIPRTPRFPAPGRGRDKLW